MILVNVQHLFQIFRVIRSHNHLLYQGIGQISCIYDNMVPYSILVIAEYNLLGSKIICGQIYMTVSIIMCSSQNCIVNALHKSVQVSFDSKNLKQVLHIDPNYGQVYLDNFFVSNMPGIEQ